MARTTGPDKVLIANHHTAPILLPRSAAVGVNIEPIALAPGVVTSVDSKEWEERKKVAAVKYYVDHGILSEVNVTGDVPVYNATTSSPQIPDNLKTEEETKNTKVEGTAPVSASVRRTTAQTAEVKVD